MRKRKKKLFFVPHYIGSLRYFEKLKPFLEETYSVSFLLAPLSDQRYCDEMVEYCKKNNFQAYVIDSHPLPPILQRIHLYVLFKRARLLKKSFRGFFENEDVAKIISFNDCGFPLHYFMGLARARGIATMVLQWAVVSPGQKSLPHKVSPIYRRLAHKFVWSVYLFVKKRLLEFAVGERLDIAKHALGGGSAERFGVINMCTLEYLRAKGVPREKMSVVGYMDFYRAEVMMSQFESDPLRRSECAVKYHIDTTKKNIIVFSGPYNIKDATFLSDAEQYRHIELTILQIREVCSAREFDILLKIHPAEDYHFYKHLEQYGVKIYDKVADNVELISLADLYIAESTTTNYIPVLMNKDSIFINFLKLELVELNRETYSIIKYISDKDEFKQLLSAFKAGQLKKQYTADEDIFTKDSLQKILEWVG